MDNGKGLGRGVKRRKKFDMNEGEKEVGGERKRRGRLQLECTREGSLRRGRKRRC